MLRDVLGGDRRDRLIRPTWRCTRHGGDDAQIGVDGDVVGEVPVDDGEDEPAMETVQASEPAATSRWRRASRCGFSVDVSSALAGLEKSDGAESASASRPR